MFSIHYDGIIYSLQGAGGISTYFDNIISGAVREAHKVSLSIYNGSGSARVARQPWVRNTQISRLPWRPLERHLSAGIPKNVNGFLFHSTYYRVPRVPVRRTIVTLHDFTYERCIGGLPAKVHTSQKWRALKHADAIICVSQSTFRDLVEFCGGEIASKAVVIYNGVSNDFRRNPDITKEFSAIFVGSRAAYKNFPTAVHAASVVPDLFLHVVGGGALTRQERAMLDNKMGPRYKHHEDVGNMFLNDLYNRCSYLLYPSDYEGFGIPPLEAIRCGCIPVAKGNSSLPEVLGPNGWLAGPDNFEEVFVQLARESSEADRKALINQISEHTNNFSWERCIKETSDLYRKVWCRDRTEQID